MNLCICCYDRTYCEELKNHIQQYMKRFYIKFSIFLFYSIDEVFKANISFDIIFMDIKFKEDKRIEKIISNKAYEKSILVFFHYNYSEILNKYINKNFSVFVKSIMYRDIVELFNSTFYIHKNDKKILIYNGMNQICLRLNDIVYIEANNKEIGVRTFNEFIIVKETLSSIEGKINTINFYKPHRSYLVNMDYIKAFNHKFITMDNEEKIVISRLKREDFINTFTSYINSNLCG